MMLKLIVLPNGRVLIAPADGPFTETGKERIADAIRAAGDAIVFVADVVEVTDLRTPPIEWRRPGDVPYLVRER